MREAVYGDPPPALAAAGPDAVQVSPLIVGAAPLGALAEASLERMVVLAPPGTLERAYVIAQTLRAVKPGGEVVVLAPKSRGGARLNAELTALGCAPHEEAKRHHRICRLTRPQVATGLADALTASGPWRRRGAMCLTPGSAFSRPTCGRPSLTWPIWILWS